jgi:hypothetical protein
LLSSLGSQIGVNLFGLLKFLSEKAYDWLISSQVNIAFDPDLITASWLQTGVLFLDRLIREPLETYIWGR